MCTKRCEGGLHREYFLRELQSRNEHLIELSVAVRDPTKQSKRIGYHTVCNYVAARYFSSTHRVSFSFCCVSICFLSTEMTSLEAAASSLAAWKSSLSWTSSLSRSSTPNLLGENWWSRFLDVLSAGPSLIDLLILVKAVKLALGDERGFEGGGERCSSPTTKRRLCREQTPIT